MTTFFTSDTHFSHARIIELCQRPFSSVDEMDETMALLWNAHVEPDDTIYHLGDFTLKGADVGEKFLSRLNGKKILIVGNHDQDSVVRSSLWDYTAPYLEINEDGQHIVLCHYAMRVWRRSHKGALMLYGHSHGTLPGNSQSCDVGMDAWRFKPVTLKDIRARLEKSPAYSSGDHHEAKPA